MPSLLGSSYAVSAMVQSVMPPAPAATNDTKSTTSKSIAAPASSGAPVASDRVSAFLAVEQSDQANRSRPEGPPPPPPGGGEGPAGAAGASGDQSGAVDEAESALILLEETETDDEDASETADDTDSQAFAILFDEAETYKPSAFY